MRDFALLVFLSTAAFAVEDFSSFKDSSRQFIFPMPNTPSLSGSFGEYRKNLLHQGIDVRTYGLNNIPVMAMADGWLRRIAGAPDSYKYGFGKALYLKHVHNYTSLYGHLNKLSDFKDLNAAWLLFQLMSQGRYFSVYYPANFLTVKQADHVAYTGEKGSGRSHLHFELWNANDQRLNAIKPRFMKTFDTESPVIQGLNLFTPGLAMPGKKSTRQNCKAEKSTNSLLISAQQKHEHYPTVSVYLCRYNLYVDGDDIHFQVDTYDHANARNKMGVVYIHLLIDGKTIFKVDIDQIDRSQRYWGRHMYDMSRTRLYPANYWYKLYGSKPYRGRKPRLPGWVKEDANNGWFDSTGWKKDSLHYLEVVVGDAQGNFSVLKANLVKKEGRRPSYPAVQYNLKTPGVHKVTEGLLTVTTPYIRSRAKLEVFPYKKKIRSYMKPVSGPYTVRYRGRGKVSYFFKARENKKRFVYSAWGKDLEARYDQKRGGYYGELPYSMTIVLADDVSAPVYNVGPVYGPLEQDYFFLRIGDTGSGVDFDSSRIYIDGQRLSSADIKNWGIYYDNDRKGILVPTGFSSKKSKFQKGRVHIIWVRAVDKAGNYGKLWEGYLHLADQVPSKS